MALKAIEATDKIADKIKEKLKEEKVEEKELEEKAKEFCSKFRTRAEKWGNAHFNPWHSSIFVILLL